MKDVNNTRYHLLLGREDWNRSQSDGAGGKQWEYDNDRQGIQLQAEVFTFQQIYRLVLLSLTDGQSLPEQGTQLVAIARNDQNSLNIRIFNRLGKQVVDWSEANLTSAPTIADQLASLKTLLQPYWDSNAPPLSPSVQKRIINTAISITGIPQPERRDSDRDVYGHRYWIDETSTQIRVRWAQAQEVETLFPKEPEDCAPPITSGVFRPATPPTQQESEPLSGLAIISEGYLVVGSPTTGSLLAFDLYALDSGYVRLPLPQTASEERPTRFDLAALHDGGLLVLDRDHQQVWRLNRHLRPVPAHSSGTGALTLFQPESGRPRRESLTPPATRINLTQNTDLRITDPMAIAPLPDGSFWVLDQPHTGASILWRYHQDDALPQSIELVTTNLVEPDEDNLDLGLIRGCDLAYLPDRDRRGQF